MRVVFQFGFSDTIEEVLDFPIELSLNLWIESNVFKTKLKTQQGDEYNDVMFWKVSEYRIAKDDIGYYTYVVLNT